MIYFDLNSALFKLVLLDEGRRKWLRQLNSMNLKWIGSLLQQEETKQVLTFSNKSELLYYLSLFAHAADSFEWDIYLSLNISSIL